MRKEGQRKPEANMIEGEASAEAKTVSNLARYKRWLGIAIFTIFVLSGQSTATLLGRLYFEKGGNSKWMETLFQTAGFPLLIPFLFIYRAKKHSSQYDQADQKPSLCTIVSLYLLLDILMAADVTLLTIGLANLQVSTFSLICASQLAFNALFSYFLNALKFTPCIINSLVLLTTSSALLVFQNDQQGSSSSVKMNFAVGFLCTLGGAVLAGLLFSVTQLAFKKYLKVATYRVVFELIIYQNFVASLLILVALFASGEWESIRAEIEEYKLGRASYVITLVGTATSWQIYSIGIIGLIFEVSSLFSNVISALSVPIVPILALVFFQDSMNWVKVMAMLLALWGFTSYIYQTYIDDLNSRTETTTATHLSQVNYDRR